jgi:hypothetical protein
MYHGGVNMATREEIKAILGYLVMAYPNFKPDFTSPINTLDVYYDILKDISEDELKLAVRSCVAGPSAFAPSPGEIRSKVTGLHVKASGVPSAGEAWEEVMRKMVSGGCHNGTPEYSHPLIRKAVQAIGIVNIGMSEDVMVERAHFLKIYASYLERAIEDDSMLPEAVEYIQTRRQIEGGILMLTDRLSAHAQERARAFERGE